jgi:hypothetical protein
MADPFSITAGAVALLQVCLKVSLELKRFRNGASEAKTIATAMLTDVKGLRDVLQSMEDTFEDIQSQQGSQPTGHIGTHWKNLLRSLHDGCAALHELEELLGGINKDVPVLDASRRQIRLKTASEQITSFRQQVQTYRDGLQLSLQTIIL